MAAAIKNKTEVDQSKKVVPSTIASQLHAMIATGVYAPGLRLGQTKLAIQFESSRMPVREALKMLLAEGLVEHDPNRGFFVARFSSPEARQLFQLRDLIETELLNTIEWSSKEKLTEIRAHDKAQEQLLNAGNRAEWWKRHREFQESIFNLSPDKIIVREALRLWSLTDRYRALAPVPRRPSAERDIVNRTDIIHALAQKDMPILLRARAKRRNAFKIQVLEILMDRGL